MWMFSGGRWVGARLALVKDSEARSEALKAEAAAEAKRGAGAAEKARQPGNQAADKKARSRGLAQ